MSSDIPHINEEMIAELREIMADDFDLLISTFVNDSETRLLDIRQTLEESNAGAFARACHSLKGSATNVGVLRLAELCRQGEIKGNQQDLNGASELLEEIESEFKTVLGLLKGGD